MVSDDLDIEEAANVELLGPELRHDGRLGVWNWAASLPFVAAQAGATLKLSRMESNVEELSLSTGPGPYFGAVHQPA